MAISIPPNSTTEEILQLMRNAGMTRDSQVSYNTPSGGQVTMPAVLPAQDSGYGGGSQQQGPISQAVTQQAAPTGPRIYAPAPAPVQAPAQEFNMSNYLDSKFGASAPRIVSVTSNPSMTSTLGRAGGNDNYMNSIIAAITGQFNKANAANEGRFKEAKKTLGGFGKSYENQINQNFAQDTAQQEQQAISRGLGNSTIRNSLLGGARRRQQDALLNLKDRLASANVNLLQSKYDNAPDPMAMAQLLQQASSGAYGSGNSLSSIAGALGLTRG